MVDSEVRCCRPAVSKNGGSDHGTERAANRTTRAPGVRPGLAGRADGAPGARCGASGAAPGGARGGPACGARAPPRAGRRSPPCGPCRPCAFRPLSRTPRISLGGRVLAWVGGLAVLLGLVFLFALGISSGWIGEAARTAIGAAGSVGLLALGIWLHERKARTDAALACVATGISGLFVSITVAAQVVLALPQLLAVVLAIGVGAIGTVLAVRWESRGIAALGILGALSRARAGRGRRRGRHDGAPLRGPGERDRCAALAALELARAGGLRGRDAPVDRLRDQWREHARGDRCPHRLRGPRRGRGGRSRGPRPRGASARDRPPTCWP